MTSALIGFAALLVLCFLGFRVGFATLVVGFIGFATQRGFEPALTMVGQQVFHDSMNYNLSVIPLFILMGVFIVHARVSRDLYDAAYAALGRFRGGLALATVLAAGGFSAVCGSTLATAATMAKVAMPPMQKYKYSERLASGTIAAGGTLGIMIPPSVPLVIYGLIAEQDIGLLFIAGVLPGLMLVILFMICVGIVVRKDPLTAPLSPPLDPLRKKEAIRGTLPILILFFVVLGGIYSGAFTATEAAGIGSFGAALIALMRGRLSKFSDWRKCMVEATSTTATIFIVLLGAIVFSQFINLSGMPYDLLDLVESWQLSPFGIVIFVCIIAILMGMVFEAIGILVLLVPVFLPVLLINDIDMIWFGILIVLVSEIGLITPPIGMNVFVVKSMLPDIPLIKIFLGVIPYIFALLVGLILVLAFPSIATFLPGLMR